VIISFFGPDGSGKTTLSKTLKEYISRRGRKTRHIRLRSHHLAMYILLTIMRKLRLVPHTYSPRILTYSIKRYFNNSRLFVYLELINVVIWVMINVKIRNLFTRSVVIAERYIPDFIVDMLLLSPNKKTLDLLIRTLTPFMRDTIKILLYATPDDMLKRKQDEKLSRRYLNAQLLLYAIVARRLGVDLVLNTSKYDKTASFTNIKQLLTKWQL